MTQFHVFLHSIHLNTAALPAAMTPEAHQGFSFFPTKNLGCAGDGGMIVTDNEELYRLCQAYRVHGSGENGLLAYGKEKKVSVDLEHLDSADRFLHLGIQYIVMII